MPRINLEARLFSDARFIDFMLALGDKEKAVGAFALACVAGAHWYLQDPDRMIPLAEWKKQKLNNKLIEYGLATVHGEKIRLAGADDQFAWLLQRSESGKKGAEARWHPPSPAIRTMAVECRPMASFSSSSSLSSDSEKTQDSEKRGNGKLPLSPLALFWNEHRETLPRVIATSQDRARKEKIRIEHLGVETLQKAILAAAKSKFCRGSNKRGWKATYDFLIDSDNNVLKILEGKYDSEPNVPAPPVAAPRLSDAEKLARERKAATESFKAAGINLSTVTRRMP